jgi:dTDP-4-amino-4,6-dideoxygalactose transaminase
MYASAWPGLSPVQLFRPPAAAALPFPWSAPSHAYFYRARNAIYHLVRGLGLDADDEILVPAYHSGNEVGAIRAAGAQIRYYGIDRALRPDVDALARLITPKTRAVFVIHFLGWPQPIAEIQSFCRSRGLLLIEDCALALLSETEGRPLGTFGDHAVFCLYKTLPVPNGGLLVHNGGGLRHVDGLRLRPCGFAPLAGRSSELLLEWLRARSNATGHALFALKRTMGRVLRASGTERAPVGDMGFDPAQLDLAISPVSQALLRRYDYAAIRSRRRDNFHRLRAALGDRVTLLRHDLPEGVCPLFFPILVPDKGAAARALWARGVDAVEFWNDGDPAADDFPDVRFLRRHVLELPLHQDLGAEQIDFVAEQVRALELRFPC